MRAARLLRRDYPDITLNIVNIGKERLLLEEGDININCYGYLDKGNPTERKQYYNLVTNARILVNPSETWAAYSSTVECMYNYTPIIIKPYEAFEMDYGKENNFGIYLENTEVNTVAAAIRKIFEMTEEDYRALCLNAHEKVKDQTWDVYAEKMAALMEGIK